MSNQPPPPGAPQDPPAGTPLSGQGSTPPGWGPPPGWTPPAGPPPGYAPPPPGYPPNQAYPPQGHDPVQSAGYPPPWAQVPVYKPGIVALRPLRLGDVYDGAFKAIRQNPKTMVGLAALVTTAFMLIPALVSIVLAMGDNLMAVPELSDPAGPGSEVSSTEGLGMSLAQGVGGLFALPATVVLTGICVHVVHRAVLGRRTAIGEAWASARGRLLRLLGLTVLGGIVVAAPLAVVIPLAVFLGLSGAEGPAVAVGVLGGITALAVILFLQIRLLYLAPAALMLEGRGIRSSFGRAWSLSRGQFWRLFGIWLLTGLVVGIASQVISIPFSLVGLVAVFASPDSSLAGLLLVLSGYVATVVVGAVTTPFSAGVSALLYLDQRIRKEGYDVELIATSQHSAS